MDKENRIKKKDEMSNDELDDLDLFIEKRKTQNEALKKIMERHLKGPDKKKGKGKS